MTTVNLNTIHADFVARLVKLEPLLVHNLSRAQDEYHLEYLVLPRVNAIYERLLAVRQIIQFPEKLVQYRFDGILSATAAITIDLNDIAYEYEEYAPLRDDWVAYLVAAGLTDTCPYLHCPSLPRKYPYRVYHEGFGGVSLLDKTFDSVYDAIYAALPHLPPKGTCVMDDNISIRDATGLYYEDGAIHAFAKRYLYGFGRNKTLRKEPDVSADLVKTAESQLGIPAEA